MKRSPVTVMFILFVYGLFNDTDGSSFYGVIASTGWLMRDELERMCEEEMMT